MKLSTWTFSCLFLAFIGSFQDLMTATFSYLGTIMPWFVIAWLIFLLGITQRRVEQLQAVDQSFVALLLRDLYIARDLNPKTTLHQFIAYREHVGAFKRVRAEADPHE